MFRRQRMHPREYIGTFALIGAAILLIQLVLLGDSFSGSVALTSVCVAVGGTLGVAYRRRAQRDGTPKE